MDEAKATFDKMAEGSFVSDEQLDLLEAKVTARKYDYNGHITYVSALRDRMLWDRLRKARISMRSMFPLSPGKYQLHIFFFFFFFFLDSLKLFKYLFKILFR